MSEGIIQRLRNKHRDAMVEIYAVDVVETVNELEEILTVINQLNVESDPCGSLWLVDSNLQRRIDKAVKGLHR